MTEKFDIRDASGRKIGTIEPSLGFGPLILIFIAIVIIGIPIALILGFTSMVSSSIHPVMPYTRFSVQDARIRTSGPVQYGGYLSWSYERPNAWHQVLLYPRGSVEFVINNEYSDGLFSCRPYMGGDYVTIALIVNESKVAEQTWGRFQKQFPDPGRGNRIYNELTINLHKGINTIRIVNNDLRGGKLTLDGFRINDRMCDGDSFFYSVVYAFACGDESRPSTGKLAEQRAQQQNNQEAFQQLSLAPKIVRVEAVRQGTLVFLRLFFTDSNNDATGFGFRGVNGAGWAEENHPFSSPSYGRVSPGRIEYPFNHGCGTRTEYESDVEAWIYDRAGRRSTPVTVHLECHAERE
jgi:hypothetical protein